MWIYSTIHLNIWALFEPVRLNACLPSPSSGGSVVVVVDLLVVDELFVVEGVVVALTAGSAGSDSDPGRG